MRRAAVALAAVLAVAACSSSGSPAQTAPAGTLTVTSPQFKADAKIPDEFTCKGAGRVPTIAWTGDLTKAKAIAVVVDDPDAPNGTYTHLVVLDLSSTARTLTSLEGAKQGLNSDGTTGWTPPCPPSGTHHYRFTVYGLSKPTGLAEGATIENATAAIKATTSTQGTLVGLVSS